MKQCQMLFDILKLGIKIINSKFFLFLLCLQECTDKCCDPLTCRLASGAQCNTGECCSESCQFHPLGTNCRNASNECDIMEYCSGDSPRCPRDLFKQDTTLCNDELNYCYAGQCLMREDQCKLYYGVYTEYFQHTSILITPN